MFSLSCYKVRISNKKPSFYWKSGQQGIPVYEWISERVSRDEVLALNCCFSLSVKTFCGLQSEDQRWGKAEGRNYGFSLLKSKQTGKHNFGFKKSQQSKIVHVQWVKAEI